MTRTAYIFIDFDGVTHPWGQVEDFRSLPLIESVVSEFDEARLVISSDWRMLFSLARLRERFSASMQERVLGMIPVILPRTGAELHGLREREAMQWLVDRGEDPRQAAWCALDDAPGNWLSRSRLLLTDFKRGFSDEDAAALRRMLRSFRLGLDRQEALPASLRPPSLYGRAAVQPGAEREH